MFKLTFFLILFFGCFKVSAQKIEKVYLDKKDSSKNYYIAVLPENKTITSFMFLLDGFGAEPQNVIIETKLPEKAARQGILTILPVLETGSFYFGTDSASQASLKKQIENVVKKYDLQGKDFYIGGFSIGGSCAVKYSELAIKNNYPIKPKAVFAGDPPLDWERFYYSCKRITRLSEPQNISGEVTALIDKIEKEMKGTPETARENFYNNSPYSFSDTTQRAIKPLVHTPLMIVAEPDIQWWLKNRGYDYNDLNVVDHAAMINELQKLGNKKAILVTTEDKGYRQPGNKRHPHSWSILDPETVISWLLKQE